jgi:hypothetical protein
MPVGDEPATKQDIADLRVEWRNEIITQTRWLAALFFAQFFAQLAAVYFIVSQVPR